MYQADDSPARILIADDEVGIRNILDAQPSVVTRAIRRRKNELIIWRQPSPSLQEEVAERQRAEAQVNCLSYYDSLTTLPNQELFRATLTRARCASHTTTAGNQKTILLSIDRFKEFNDALGQPVQQAASGSGL